MHRVTKESGLTDRDALIVKSYVNGSIARRAEPLCTRQRRPPRRLDKQCLLMEVRRSQLPEKFSPIGPGADRTSPRDSVSRGSDTLPPDFTGGPPTYIQRRANRYSTQTITRTPAAESTAIIQKGMPMHPPPLSERCFRVQTSIVTQERANCNTSVSSYTKSSFGSYAPNFV